MDIAPIEPPSPVEDAVVAEDTSARPKGVFPPPRKLTDEQERELTRLYAETSTPTAAIARTFGISEVSVGRMAQRNGAVPRRRGAARASAPDREAAGARSSRAAEAESVGQASNRRGRQRRADASETRPNRRRQHARSDGGAAAPQETVSGPKAAAQAGDPGGRRRFRIRFFAETVIEAQDMRDALRQAEALGATDVTDIVRQDS